MLDLPRLERAPLVRLLFRGLMAKAVALIAQQLVAVKALVTKTSKDQA